MSKPVEWYATEVVEARKRLHAAKRATDAARRELRDAETDLAFALAGLSAAMAEKTVGKGQP